METIISSLISAGVALLICVIQNNKAQTLIQYRLDELTKRMDKHNQIIERVYHLEQDSAIHAEQLGNLAKDIDELKKGA